VLKMNKVASYDLSLVQLHDADNPTCCKVRLLAVSSARSPNRLPTPPYETLEYQNAFPGYSAGV